MKALVIGYGSIGQRHARLLGEMGLDVAVVSRRDIEFANVASSIESALRDWQPQYVVIASQTHEHYDDLSRLAANGFNGTLLVEKPLFAVPTEIPRHAFAKVGIAYQMRFLSILQSLRERLAGKRVFAVNAYVGQFLPDWRPHTDYREGYSAIKNQGGGVLRDLSHELDYLTWLFGGWDELTAVGGNFSDLEINSDDVFSILFRAQRCPAVTVHMNYLHHELRRDVTVLYEDGTAVVDFVSGTLSINGKVDTFTYERDTPYLAQHQAMLSNGDDSYCTLEEGLTVTAMIAAAERASANHTWAKS